MFWIPLPTLPSPSCSRDFLSTTGESLVVSVSKKEYFHTYLIGIETIPSYKYTVWIIWVNFF